MTWTIESSTCDNMSGYSKLKINDTDYLLINSAGDFLIIDETLWNVEPGLSC